MGMKAGLERFIVGVWYERLPRPVCQAATLLLAPLSACYRAGLEFHQLWLRLRARRLPACVISVGNVVVGGTGKTPLTLWIARQLERQGRRPAILTRGYGRASREVVRVPRALSSAALQACGDEPVLMASRLPRVPVWVGKDRFASGLRALSVDGADVLILDDGFQHRGLHRDLDLALLDARRPFANGRLFPSGPLREPVQRLHRADALVITSRSLDDLLEAEPRCQQLGSFDGPVFSCRLDFNALSWQDHDGNRVFSFSLPDLAGARVVAFAGIARPQAFFRSLGKKGLDVRAALAFPDHHGYGRRDIARILATSRDCRARFLVTTEKDWVRLPAWLRPVVLSASLEVEMIDRGQALGRYLASFVEQHHAPTDRPGPAPAEA